MDLRKDSSAKRVRMTPENRRAQLIAAARKIFVSEGYVALSLRGIAVACGVRLSTVQHHFDGRAALIDAMVGAIIAECMEIYGCYRHAAGMTPDERLRATIAVMIGQNEDPQTALLFPELWALAEREPVAAEAVDRLYGHGRELIADLICAARPKLSAQHADHTAQLVMALADGLLISSGTRCGRSRSTPEQRNRFIDAAMGLAYGGDMQVG